MIENFRYLLLIRLFSLTGIIVVFVYLNLFTETSLPLTPICIIIFFTLCITLWSWLNLNKQNHVSKRSFFTQLLFDIITLSLLVYFSGGSANPLISLFIIPVIFSAASLPRRYTWALTILTIISYTILMFYQVPLSSHQHHHETVNLHLWGMWYGFILSVFLIAYFVSRISSNLHEHQKLLAEVREASLRDEQIIALGTLAANTAHELGSPLSTISILASEIDNEYSKKDSELANDLSLLKSQVTRCKSIISNMAKDAGELQADTGNKKPLKDYLVELTEAWERGLTDIEVIKLFKNDNSPNIVVDRSLTYALTNILMNSAQASPTEIVVESGWDDDELTISIKDNGHGIAKNILAHVGNSIVSGSGIEKGMGIGLFLSKTTVERFGGTLSIDSGKQGTIINITIPLTILIADTKS
jgi:two-component system, sensor histidine kinase RegB